MHFMYSLKYLSYNAIHAKSDEFMNKYILYRLLCRPGDWTQVRLGGK